MDDPSARHQRLPAQGGRHPGLPVGAVAPPRPAVVRRAHGVVAPRGRRLRRRPARRRVPHRAGAGPRCSCPPRPLRRRIRDLAEDVGASLVVLDPALPLGLVGPALWRRCPTPWCCTAPRSPCRAGSPGPRQALAPVLGRCPSGRVRRAAIRPPKRGVPPAPACRRWSRSRPGSTPSGCGPSPRRARRKARADLGPPRRRPAGGEREPAGPPQGHGRAHRRRGRAACRRSPA